MAIETTEKNETPRRVRPNILFVDDERRVLNSMRALFKREYNLFLTTQGHKALEIIKQNDIDVIVADQRMPKMSGVEVLSRVKKESPNTIRILLTGYANPDSIEGAINEGEVYRFLSKPCPVGELRKIVREAAETAIKTSDNMEPLANVKKSDRELMASLARARVKPSLASRLARMMKGLNDQAASRRSDKAIQNDNDDTAKHFSGGPGYNDPIFKQPEKAQQSFDNNTRSPTLSSDIKTELQPVDADTSQVANTQDLSDQNGTHPTAPQSLSDIIKTADARPSRTKETTRSIDEKVKSPAQQQDLDQIRQRLNNMYHSRRLQAKNNSAQAVKKKEPAQTPQTFASEFDRLHMPELARVYLDNAVNDVNKLIDLTNLQLNRTTSSVSKDKASDEPNSEALKIKHNLKHQNGDAERKKQAAISDQLDRNRQKPINPDVVNPVSVHPVPVDPTTVDHDQRHTLPVLPIALHDVKHKTSASVPASEQVSSQVSDQVCTLAPVNKDHELAERISTEPKIDSKNPICDSNDVGNSDLSIGASSQSHDVNPEDAGSRIGVLASKLKAIVSRNRREKSKTKNAQYKPPSLSQNHTASNVSANSYNDPVASPDDPASLLSQLEGIHQQTDNILNDTTHAALTDDDTSMENMVDTLEHMIHKVTQTPMTGTYSKTNASKHLSSDQKTKLPQTTPEQHDTVQQESNVTLLPNMINQSPVFTDDKDDSNYPSPTLPGNFEKPIHQEDTTDKLTPNLSRPKQQPAPSQANSFIKQTKYSAQDFAQEHDEIKQVNSFSGHEYADNLHNNLDIPENGEQGVDIDLGGHIHKIVDMTDSVEIIMSGDTHTTLDTSQLAKPKPSSSMDPYFAAMKDISSAKETQYSDLLEIESDPSRMRVVGTGKYKVSVVVFTRDKLFARSIGRALQGFFYTFHATSVAQLTHAISHVDPAVLISDASDQPELIQQLMASLKQRVPDMVTLVSCHAKDASLMVKLINHGQVFRVVSKPLSATACKRYVREALRKHLQLRKNPELLIRHRVANHEDASKLPSNIARLVASISRVRTALSRGS